MMVIGGEEDIKPSLMTNVGQGSKPHNLVGDLDMSFLTSSLVNGLKETSRSGV